MQLARMRVGSLRQASCCRTRSIESNARAPSSLRKIHLAPVHATEADAESNGVPADPADNEYSNFDALSELVKFVNDSDIELLEMKHSGYTISMKKRAALPQPPQVIHAAAPVLAAAAPAPVAAAPAAAPAPAAPRPAAAPAAAPKVEGVEMTSPMGGTFYRTPAPGEPSFVKEGDRVTKGQTIGIIEAMKLMNEIEAEMSGEVVKFLLDNGSPISPGQPLVVIKP